MARKQLAAAMVTVGEPVKPEDGQSSEVIVDWGVSVAQLARRHEALPRHVEGVLRV